MSLCGSDCHKTVLPLHHLLSNTTTAETSSEIEALPPLNLVQFVISSNFALILLSGAQTSHTVARSAGERFDRL